MDNENGELIVNLARKAIKQYLQKSVKISIEQVVRGELREKRGVFVTIKSYPEGSLRGCIGMPLPIKPLIDAVIDSSISAAVRDPRFPTLNIEEMENVTIEVTVLTQPSEIRGKSNTDIINQIEIGKHGLIIEKGSYSGLLLPQVPVEQKWGKEEYLEGISHKAGLLGNAWAEDDSRIFMFEGEIFSEKSPGGDIVRKEIAC